ANAPIRVASVASYNCYNNTTPKVPVVFGLPKHFSCHSIAIHASVHKQQCAQKSALRSAMYVVTGFELVTSGVIVLTRALLSRPAELVSVTTGSVSFVAPRARVRECIYWQTASITSINKCFVCKQMTNRWHHAN